MNKKLAKLSSYAAMKIAINATYSQNGQIQEPRRISFPTFQPIQYIEFRVLLAIDQKALRN